MKTLAVLLPTYNAAHFLAEAIDSILEQTYTDFDLYIYDDCSNDGTKTVVDSFSDSRIIYVKNEENLGISKTLNKGIKSLASRYKFIARMDADDWSFPNRFEKQIEFLELNDKIALCGTQAYTGKDFNSSNMSNWKNPTVHNEIKYFLLFTACFFHPSIIYRSSFFLDHDIDYNENIKTCEDWDLWTRLIHYGEVANLPEFLMKYRIVGNSNHRAEENQRKHLKERSRVIANHWNSFKIECDETFIYNVYFNDEARTKKELKSQLNQLIQMSNKLCVISSDELNKAQLEKIKYRLLRNIKRTWKLSGVSKFSIAIWVLILRNVAFSGMFNTIKTIMR